MDKDSTPASNNSTNPTQSQTATIEERELVSRLKAAIDRNGRYSYRLDDMAAGFSAGRGLNPIAARMEIERKFTYTYDMSPKDYMDQRYQALNKDRVPTEHSRSNGRAM